VTERLVIGLGGNLGGDAAVLERFARARAAFTAWGAVRGSTVYRTAAIGGPGPDFLNAALAIAVDPPAPLPADLVANVLAIEAGLGRDRRGEARNGPRAIDLDVLLWGERVARYDGLAVPHPRLHERRFALAPLRELVGDDVVVRGRTLRAWYDALPDQRVEPTAHRI
jgi:2-amino-4-hydroxy-6-hydroxymethyldihydropteridine diphosphokinase